MTPSQCLGLALLTAASAAGAAMTRWRPAGRRSRSSGARLLRDLASASDRAAGEFEAALSGIRSSDADGLPGWLARLVGAGRRHGQTLDTVHRRLRRFAAAERGLASTAAEVARQRDRVESLCRTAESVDRSRPSAAAAVADAVSGVIAHERRLRAEAADAAARLEGRADRFAGAERDALTDPVTRLPNRRAFEERLESEIRRPEPALAVAVVLLDEAAPAGEASRPASSEAVVAVAGRVLRDAVRPADFVARHGARGFAVLLPGGGLDAAESVLAGCRRAAGAAVVRLDGDAVTFSIRGGVAEWRPGDTAAAVMTAALAAAHADAGLRCDASHRAGGTSPPARDRFAAPASPRSLLTR